LDKNSNAFGIVAIGNPRQTPLQCVHCRADDAGNLPPRWRALGEERLIDQFKVGGAQT